MSDRMRPKLLSTERATIRASLVYEDNLRTAVPKYKIIGIRSGWRFLTCLMLLTILQLGMDWGTTLRRSLFLQLQHSFNEFNCVVPIVIQEVS